MPDSRGLRHLLSGVFAIATVIFLASSGAQRAEALANCDVADMTFDSEEQAFLGLINDYRAANGLPALTVSTNLNRAAEWEVYDLGHRLLFSHTDSLGRGPQERIAECGGAPWFGENIAAGTVIDTAQKAFNLWRSSSGHNRNMLLADYKQIGIARYYAPGSRYTWYWSTTFSVTNDGTNALTGLTSGASEGLISPLPNTTLPSSTATFQWASDGADERWLTIGTTFGGYDLYSASLGTAAEVTVAGLPAVSETIYVRLWTRVANLWSYEDYTYSTSGGY